MLPLRRLLLVALACPTLAQEGAVPGGARAADELYPCRRAEKVLRAFHLESDAPELAKVNPALAELGAELAYGPRTASGRPGHAFVVVRAPREVSAKKLGAVLRKGGAAVEELEALAFDGRTGEDHDFGLGGYGVTKRDFVMGMSGDVLWYDAGGTWSQLFGPPGKMKAGDLAKRYEKLYAPYGGAKLGGVVQERFTWTLAASPDEKTRARVLKTLEKLPGVVRAALEGSTLTTTVALDGLTVLGDVGRIPEEKGEPLDDAGRQAPRIAFDAGAVYELLAAEGLVR
jgi:hypothetical protein